MHPEVERAYREAKFQVPANPADTNQEIFRRKTRRARDEDKQFFINQVWRVSQGPKKDFIFYERKTVIPDLAGNNENDTEIVGRYDKPKFRNIYNNSTGEPESVALAGFETVYDIPYSKEKMQEILDSGNSSDTVFTLSIGTQSGARKYGGFSADDFVNRSFDELTQLALYGTIQPTVQNIKPADIRAHDGSDFQRERLKTLSREEEVAAEEAKIKLEQIRESQKRQQEEFQKVQEEEAQKRQETVDQQSEKRVVRAEATAQFSKDAPGPAEGVDKPMSLQEQKEASGEVPKRDTRAVAGLRPEKEMIGEEVSFHLGRPEDQNLNEDEEIARQFREQEAEAAKHVSSKKSRKSKQEEEG